MTERSNGRTPTGAELDRIAGTNNYGRKVLSRWRVAAHDSGAMGIDGSKLKAQVRQGSLGTFG